MGQRAIVEIPWGRLASRKALIAPGGALRVGRSEPADLIVAHDRWMSGVHFELSWDGERGRLRDLDSAIGTWLDGERVIEGEIRHGAWIRAGQTAFMVHREGATEGPAWVMSEEEARKKGRALEALSAEREPLFALLDAARSDRVLTLLRESAEEHRSLYEGVRGDAMADVAPYLVALPKGARLLEPLVREGWGEGWGVYLTSRLPLEELRRHLQRTLLVREGELGQRLYFRFYDPRVLRAFLPRCPAPQADEIFGEIGWFSMEGEGEELLRFGDPLAAARGAGCAGKSR